MDEQPTQSRDQFQQTVNEYADELRKRGCSIECGAGNDAHPIKHRPTCPVRILNPPPYDPDDLAWQRHLDGNTI